MDMNGREKMMEENRAEQLLFLWEKISEDAVRLLRVFGEQPVVTVPGFIDGRCVRELGDYCFSRRKLPENEIRYSRYCGGMWESGLFALNDKVKKDRIVSEQEYMDENIISLETIERDGKLHELSEKYIKEVQLPSGLEKIGSCAFYNCTEMERITVYPKLTEVGSDAFMNCLKLRHIQMCAEVEEKTGLKQLLAQIKWQVEVSFEKTEGTKQAVLLYPEYYESYDEIGPAHIFELNLTGEGFRARQCFKEGVVLLQAYDEIFPQACVEEGAEVLIPMAWNRLYYAMGLLPEAKAVYEAYVREQAEKILEFLIKQRELKQLSFFFERGYGTKEQMDLAVFRASATEWMEGVASLIAWRRKLFTEQTNTADVKSRYSFDDF